MSVCLVEMAEVLGAHLEIVLTLGPMLGVLSGGTLGQPFIGWA